MPMKLYRADLSGGRWVNQELGANAPGLGTAELLLQNILVEPNADTAYDTAVQHATIGGFGYFRLGTEYCSDDSFDQEIRIRRIQNPFSVYTDPFAQEPDGEEVPIQA